ncbi:MAG: AlkZ family DNA glycosylase [Thermoleophilia bacterium]|nr:AlkZ family DNA glycosylase [Thermoleophilia bacterium]
MADAAAASLTAAQVATRRLQSLGLAAPSGGDVPELGSAAHVVEHHLAMQAQDFKASQWAIGSRLDGATRADVLAAYDSGEIVRSWPMRGTVHVTLARDLPWMLDLLGERALRGVERRWQVLDIDAAMLEHARDVAVDLLRGGRRVTRAQLQAALSDEGHDFGGPRGYHVVWYLAQTGTLVQGPVGEAGDQLLVLLDEWIRDPVRFADRDDAIAELGRRYLQAHAPARVEDLMWWSSLGKRECRAAFEAASDEYVPVRRGDDEVWVRRDHVGEPVRSRPTMLALAAFDEHLLGYRVRDEVLDPAAAHLVDPGRNGVFRYTLVDRGRVIATWKRTPRAKRIVVDVAPFATLAPARERAAVAAIERWGSFVGSAVEVRFGAPS